MIDEYSYVMGAGNKRKLFLLYKQMTTQITDHD